MLYGGVLFIKLFIYIQTKEKLEDISKLAIDLHDINSKYTYDKFIKNSTLLKINTIEKLKYSTISCIILELIFHQSITLDIEKISQILIINQSDIKISYEGEFLDWNPALIEDNSNWYRLLSSSQKIK